MKAKQSKTSRSKCVVYVRVSSRKQTSDGGGLSSQERSCRDYAERAGYEVIQVFEDVISGRFSDRPGMNDLLSFLKRIDGNQYAVIVDDITRFARDVSAHTSLRAKIMECGASIESPKLKFGEDANSRFMETLFAAIAALDREKNAEQSMDRTISRLKNGFWTFSSPLGYRYEKFRGPEGGKHLVKEEPIATIITEALEGFASGRFQSQAEVKRFLDAKPEFPRAKGQNEIKYDIVRNLLTKLVYAGYLEYAEWGVPLTRARHEPLISYDTFLLIQDRLSEKQVAPFRKDLDKDFPLRGFMVCGSCGYRLTACWSKSGTGTLYPYYLCHHKGCTERGKSTNRDKVEEQFEHLLSTLRPSAQTMDCASQMFERAWAKRKETSAEEAQRLRARAKQIEKDIDTLLNRLARTVSELTVGAYERRIAELQSEKADLEAKGQNVSIPDRDYDEMFELAMTFLSNPFEIWKNGDLEVKRTVLRLVFAKPLEFCRQTGVRTGETTLPFKALGFIESSESKMVRSRRLELPRVLPHSDLNAARLPIPPRPHVIR